MKFEGYKDFIEEYLWVLGVSLISGGMVLILNSGWPILAVGIIFATIGVLIKKS